jgi:hypothetical protein
MPTDKPPNADRPKSPRLIAVRTVIVVVGLALWFGTQSLIGSRATNVLEEGATSSVSSGDVLFHVTKGANAYLQTHSAAADGLLVASSAVIDILGVWLLASSILGRTMRPFLGLLLLFALRQISQALCVLPAPHGMIWRDPGVPSLLVTYGVANDFFFSGHTGIAVFGALELARVRYRGFFLLGLAVALFEMTTVILLRAHYSMDVFTGAIAALWASAAAERLSPRLDNALSRLQA